jgi:hypothetical protein
MEDQDRVTPEVLAEAIDGLRTNPYFHVLREWLAEIREDQISVVAICGTDTHRQYMETGVLNGIMRIKQVCDG